MSERIKRAEEMLKTDPENDKLWLERGMGLIYDKVEPDDEFKDETERSEQARLSMCMGLRYNPFNADCHHRRGRKFISQGRFIEAVADIVMASRIDRENEEHWYYQGVAAYMGGLYEIAAEALEMAIILMKKKGIEEWVAPIEWCWLAYMQLGKKEDADKVVAKVSMDTPCVPRSISYKKSILLYNGKIKPEEFLDREQLKTTDRPDLYLIGELYALGNYYYMHGEVEKSNQLLKEAREVRNYRQCFAYQLACKDLAQRGL